MTALENFCTTLDQLTDVIVTLVGIEQDRLDAASEKRHELIGALLNEEQAVLLSMRGLEQKRLHQAEELGWKGLTFREILDTADPASKEALLPRFTRLSEEITFLKQLRESADRIVKVRIHELEEAIVMAGGSPQNASSHFFHNRYV